MARQKKLARDPLASLIRSTKQSKRGRPKKQSKEDVQIKQEKPSTAKESLQEGWTRATFLIKEADLNRIKDIAYTDRRKITTVINEAIERYIKAYKGKVLKRPKEKK